VRTVRPRRRDARGFTLLEVMVALAVIAIAFTALLGLHARNLRIAAREQAYTQALLLSRSMVTEIQLGDLPDVGIAEGDFEDLYPGLYPGFRWVRTVNDPPIPVQDMREITVRVIPNGDESAASELTFFMRAETSS
jgi:general secretion pathway protein I